jgi:hypothetical protein
MLDDVQDQILAWLDHEPAIAALEILRRLKSVHPGAVQRQSSAHCAARGEGVARSASTSDHPRGRHRRRNGRVRPSSGRTRHTPAPRPPPPRVDHGGPQLLPAHRCVRLVAVTPRCAGPLCGLHGRHAAAAPSSR